MVEGYPGSREYVEENLEARRAVFILSISLMTVFLAAFQVSFPELWAGYFVLWSRELLSQAFPFALRSSLSVVVLSGLEVSGAMVAVITESRMINRVPFSWIVVQVFLLVFVIGRVF